MHPRLSALLLLILACLTLRGHAQGEVRAVVVNEFANIRFTPAIGAEVITTVSAGYEFTQITARSGDNEWLRVIYQGQEGWVNLTPLVVLQGSIESLPVADPRTIPYGGFGSPRAGRSSQTGPISGIPNTGLRLRAGPSTAYPTLASIPRDEGISLTGRTASGTWYQVNYNGLLGWVASQYVTIFEGNINLLPVDGIVADEPPSSGDVGADFQAVIRLMLARIDISQQALNDIRARWTDAALTGRASCSTAYPSRPTGIEIPLPLLAAFELTLKPLEADFDTAMANLTNAIDLFIQVCNLPGTGNPVGQATLQGALGVVNTTEQQFASLRDRLTALAPSRTPGPNECLLTFDGEQEILPVISVGTIYLEEVTRRKTIFGYCFDAIQGSKLNFQSMPLPQSNLALFMSISELGDPANFITVNRSATDISMSVGPIPIERTARYLLIIADLGDSTGVPLGQFAFRLSDLTFQTTIPFLAWDDATQSVILTTDTNANRNPASEQTGTAGGGGGSGATATPSLLPTPTGAIGTVCISLALNCNQLFTCAEAQACYQAGNRSLDANDNGIPCDETNPSDAAFVPLCTAGS